MIGDDALHLAFGRKLDAGNAYARVDRDPHILGELHHARGGRVRVEVAVTGKVDRAVQVLRAQLWHDPQRFGRRNHFHVHADGFGAAHAALKFLELIGGGGNPQAAHMIEEPKPAVQFDAVLAKLHERLRCGKLGNQAGRVRGFAAGDLTFLEKYNVGPAKLCQVIGNIGSDDPAPHDDNLRLVFHLMFDTFLQQHGIVLLDYWHFQLNTVVSIRRT